jgi:hypothetical protein
MSTDPFDVVPEADPIPRDQWGRPVIWRPWEDDGECREVRYCRIERAHGHYARASTFNGWLDDGMGLATWKVRHAALAVARASESQRALLASCWYPVKDRPCPELDGWIEEALAQAKRDEEDLENGFSRLEAAAWGTAIHRFTEPWSPPHAPERIRSDVEAFGTELDARGWKIIETELFVVHDDLWVAGTLDHLVLTPSGTVIALDKKTGKLHPLSFTIQLVAYAHGRRYDPETGHRAPLHPDLNTDVATVAHIPLGRGRCGMIPVDLKSGKHAAWMAREVDELRRSQKDLFLPVDVLDPI